MELMLEIISLHKFSLGSGAQHVFREVGGYIGRGGDCEWVLPDKTRQISRRHALISVEQSSFVIEDLSTNGVFNALGRERLAKKRKYKIEHGATYLIDEYSIQARLLNQPDSCLSVLGAGMDDLIPNGDALADDPLVALEQQDELNARRRLGMFNDLMGETSGKIAFQSNHTEAPRGAMPSVTVVPENWNEDIDESSVEPAAEYAPAVQEMPVNEVMSSVQPSTAVITGVTADSSAFAPEVEAFFKTLGFDAVPESAEERERVMVQTANLLLASVEGMLQALRNRADSKNDLRLPVTTMTLAGNNLLKFSPTAKAALQYLLGPSGGGMLPPVQAMLNGFNDLHSHNMGLIAGARAAVQAALGRVSPESIEAKLDAAGTVKFNRTARLWNTYVRMHAGLREDSNGFAAFFLDDFARAYELQVRTLYTAFSRSQGGK